MIPRMFGLVDFEQSFNEKLVGAQSFRAQLGAPSRARPILARTELAGTELARDGVDWDGVGSGWSWLGMELARDGVGSGRSWLGTELARDRVGSGRSWLGTELAGTELAGTELAGTELAGTELAGTELAGTELARDGVGWDGVGWDGVGGTELARFSAMSQKIVLAGTCEAMARSIQSRIKMLPEPARNSATKAFVGALLEHVQSKPNLPQSMGFWVGLPLIESSANYVDQSLAKAVQVVERCGDWPETMPADLNGLIDCLSGLANFISMEHNIGN
uniref:Uncharacterized protein n=1 Tax=Globodera rostochiensis TaxID=31243 RepID=A0A914I1T8_GLORO